MGYGHMGGGRWAAVPARVAGGLVALLAGSLTLAGAVPVTASSGSASSSGSATRVAAAVVGDAVPSVETEPVANNGDAADDPAVWIDAADPAHSAVIGNDKGGALEVYDLSGQRIQRITEGFFGNVDIRQGFATATGPADLAVVYRAGVRVYKIDPQTRQLTNVTDAPSGSIPTPAGGEGLCLYTSPKSGTLYAFSNTRQGVVAQFALTDTDGDGLIEGNQVRSWDVGSEIEACVADNESGDVYISEEDVGIWKYGAEPADPTSPENRTLVDGLVAAGGHLLADVEGLALVYQPDGTGYLMVSAQAAFGVDNYYAVYERKGDNGFLGMFKVVSGTEADGCSHTDGITAVAADLGPAFPHGVFICQDDSNTAPGATGNQNFKLVPLERVVTLATTPPGHQRPHPTIGAQCNKPTCTTTGAISYVDQSSSNVNSTSHQVTVPPGVRAGDGLVLFFGSNTSSAITAPVGWKLLGTVSSLGTSAWVWRRVATSSDAGAVVRVQVEAASKASLTLAAYRGTSRTDPVASFNGVPDAVQRASHTTPQLTIASSSSWALSYWSHKDSDSTQLAPPAGVDVRASGSQSGSGRVTTLLADSGGPVGSATYGGLTATAGGVATAATMWTIALR